MTITGVNNYGNAFENTYVSQKREQRNETDDLEISEGKKTETIRDTKETKDISNQNYLAKLQEKVPCLELEQGFGLSTKRDNRTTLMIHPKLLEKMQNDSEAEKKYTQTIKDIERAERTATAYYNALGGCVERTSHWYMDENGNYCHFAYTRRDDKLNEKLREEAKENAEKQIEKNRENARKKAKQLAEKLEEKAEKQLLKKIESAENREVILNEDKSRIIVETIKEVKEQSEKESPGSETADKKRAGSNVDIKI